MFTKNPFNKKDEVADLIGNILESDYKVKNEELKGNQHKIDANKNGKIDAHDFKMLRAKGGAQKDEEIDPNRNTTDTLKGQMVGKSANPFLSKKVFMDVPGNVKEDVSEEVKQVDERTLTPGETSEKERIVKGMKKSLAGFKQRYGDRAKSVMYATATKAAKKD